MTEHHVEPGAALNWTDIPISAASTCSYRITGLRSRGAYEAQVRATAPGDAHGVVSNVAEGVTQYDDGRAPKISPDVIVEGDGTIKWRVHSTRWTITIPDGMRPEGGLHVLLGLSSRSLRTASTCDCHQSP